MLLQLMNSIKKALNPNGYLYSDEKKSYPTLVKNSLPKTIHFTQELSKIELKKSVDRQGLGRFRSTCASIRTYLGTMGRRKLNTTKSIESLAGHLYLMIVRHNKYDLNEVINFNNTQQDFYEREWQTRIQRKKLKILIAIINYPKFLRKQVRIQKLKDTWKRKKEAKKLAS